MDKEITRVQFRKCRNPYTKKAEVIAVFVDEDWDEQGKEFACYMHNGQHSGCEKVWAKRQQFATEAEYKDLKDELERCFDYRFEVITRKAA